MKTKDEWNYFTDGKKTCLGKNGGYNKRNRAY